MLAVVEQDQHLAISDEPAEHFACRLAWLVGKAQHACRRHWYHVGIGDRRQVDIPNTVSEFGRDIGADLYRQARLARPARAGQGDESVVANGGADVPHFRLAPNEARQLRWKTVRGKPMGCAQRREVIVQVWMAQLDNPFRAREVPERM